MGDHFHVFTPTRKTGPSVSANTLREGLASPQDVLAMAAHTTDANTSSPMTGSVSSRWLDHPQSDGRLTCEDDDGHVSVRRRAEAALEWLTGPAQLTDLVPFFTTHRAGERVERTRLVGHCNTTNPTQSAGPEAPCRFFEQPRESGLAPIAGAAPLPVVR